jgi:hypothetical protein
MVGAPHDAELLTMRTGSAYVSERTVERIICHGVTDGLARTIQILGAVSCWVQLTK